MIELTLKPLEADEEGWVEVVLLHDELDNEEVPEGETIGYIRVVEGTEGGPHEWWDVRRIEDDGVLNKRLVDYDAALLVLALRHVAPDVRTTCW